MAKLGTCRPDFVRLRSVSGRIALNRRMSGAMRVLWNQVLIKAKSGRSQTSCSHRLKGRNVMRSSDVPQMDEGLLARLRACGTATLSSELSKLGIRDSHLQGISGLRHQQAVAGTARTMKFMPMREDLYSVDEYSDPEVQLHRHALYSVNKGDIVVVDGRGDMSSGVYGEMMITYLAKKGGAGLVVDGCIRDWPFVRELDLGVWARGVAPNFHTQTTLMPYEVNTTIACGGATVLPGDAIVADGDGAIVVPASYAEAAASAAEGKSDWEAFARIKIRDGGDLRHYYPLSSEARVEYEAWQAER